MIKLFQSIRNLFKSGETKHLVLTLQNPLNPSDTLDLKIIPETTDIANAWFNEVIVCLENQLHLEKNFCWLGWPDPNRDVSFLKNRLQTCVNRLNEFSRSNPVWGGYTINEDWDDISSHDALNQLHHHFEILMGQVWNVSEYMKTADDPTKYQIRQLNNLVHELQSRKNVEGVPFKHIEPMSVISYLNIQRSLFEDHYYDYFDINKEFGSIFLHYSQTGKTPIEAFTDNDDHVFDDNINALRYLSGEYNIWWGNSLSQSRISQIKNDLKDWLNSRGLITSEGPNFSYYVDQDGNKQGIGWITVAKIQNPFLTKEKLLEEVLPRLNILKLSAYINNKEVASHHWPYSWADQNYESIELSVLKDHFPR